MGEHLTDFYRGDVGLIGHCNDFQGGSIECSQQVESLTPARRGNEYSHHRPDKTQEGRDPEVSGIDKEDGSLSGTGFL
jgi:hypothetical protein